MSEPEATRTLERLAAHVMPEFSWEGAP
jgi:hypothetical protein